ncbi:hypothetical protein INT45_000710 [Circinella minor]|uniref:Uncharacterized protein n=1 Tax=Circinella minor TaxID=1195481 RepID=A0A8H7RUI7_9FUNG|nr:hypothetical protein INT45_000710 [Circinella minor]
MNKYEVMQDMSLKCLQYLLSGVFRPLDVLGLEISQDTNNANIQRYLYMLKDCRELLLDVSAQINDMCNNIAFQAINPPSFSSSLTQEKNFTMALADFQAALVQQTNASQAVKTASSLRNKKCTFNQTQPIPLQQFFRSGPSSQQGGYITNSNSNSNHNNNSSWQHNKQYRNTNGNNGNNKVKATNNLFRNTNQ